MNALPRTTPVVSPFARAANTPFDAAPPPQPTDAVQRGPWRPGLSTIASGSSTLMGIDLPSRSHSAPLPITRSVSQESQVAALETEKAPEPTGPSRLWSFINRVRTGLDGASMVGGMVGTGLVLASVMPAGGIVAAVFMGIHLVNNLDLYLKPGQTKLETFFRSSMFLAGVSALGWSILAITLGASNPVGWALLAVGHIGLVVGLGALLYKNHQLGLAGCIRKTGQDCMSLMFPTRSVPKRSAPAEPAGASEPA